MGRHATAIDNDPSLLSLNFAVSHLETTRLRQKPPEDMTLSSALAKQRAQGGLELGNTVTDGRAVRWDDGTSRKDGDALSGSEPGAESSAVQEAWDYLEGKSAFVETKTTTTQSLALSIQDQREKTAMLSDEIEEKKKWKYLEDDAGESILLVRFFVGVLRWHV